MGLRACGCGFCDARSFGGFVVLGVIVLVQPLLPDGFEWPDVTREWWAVWGADPRTAGASDLDWLFLLDAAVLHAAVWGAGEVALVASLRVQVNSFESRLVAVAEAAPVKRKGTPVDEIRQRREARQARAKGRAGSSR